MISLFILNFRNQEHAGTRSGRNRRERMASAKREIDLTCMFFAVDRHFGIGQDQQSNA
jgi:hypothetical protein